MKRRNSKSAWLARLRRNRRAISTMVANLLMVSIVIGLATTLFIWANASFMSYQGSASSWFSMRSDAMKEGFVIENIWFYTQAGVKYVNITVRNVSSISIRLARVYLNGSPVWQEGCDLLVGQAKTLKIAYNWSSGATYQIAVATARGNRVIEYWTPSA